MISWQPFNILMMKSAIRKPAPLPHPYTSLWGDKMCLSDLDMAWRPFSITPEDKFQDQWTPIYKFKIHRSTIKKEIIWRWTWRVFEINKKNQLMSTIMCNHPSPLPRPSSILQWKQIHMSDLYTFHRQFFSRTRGYF